VSFISIDYSSISFAEVAHEKRTKDNEYFGMVC
jgi:hypothetical protein